MPPAIFEATIPVSERPQTDALGRGYIGARTDTTQQSGQTQDKEVEINQITVYVSGCTQTGSTGMLSPNNGRLSGPTKWVCFEPTVWPDLLQFALDSIVVALDKTYLIAVVKDVSSLWDQRDKN